MFRSAVGFSGRCARVSHLLPQHAFGAVTVPRPRRALAAGHGAHLATALFNSASDEVVTGLLVGATAAAKGPSEAATPPAAGTLPLAPPAPAARLTHVFARRQGSDGYFRVAAAPDMHVSDLLASIADASRDAAMKATGLDCMTLHVVKGAGTKEDPLRRGPALDGAKTLAEAGVAHDARLVVKGAPGFKALTALGSPLATLEEAYEGMVSWRRGVAARTEESRKLLAATAVPALHHDAAAVSVGDAARLKIKVLAASGSSKAGSPTVRMGLFNAPTLHHSITNLVKPLEGTSADDDDFHLRHVSELLVEPQQSAAVHDFVNAMTRSKTAHGQPVIRVTGPRGAGKSATGWLAFLACFARGMPVVYIPSGGTNVHSTDLASHFINQNSDTVMADPALRAALRLGFRVWTAMPDDLASTTDDSDDKGGLDANKAAAAAAGELDADSVVEQGWGLSLTDLTDFLEARPGLPVGIILDGVPDPAREVARSSSDAFMLDFLHGRCGTDRFVRMEIVDEPPPPQDSDSTRGPASNSATAAHLKRENFSRIITHEMKPWSCTAIAAVAAEPGTRFQLPRAQLSSAECKRMVAATGGLPGLLAKACYDLKYEADTLAQRKLSRSDSISAAGGGCVPPFVKLEPAAIDKIVAAVEAERDVRLAPWRQSRGRGSRRSTTAPSARSAGKGKST